MENFYNIPMSDFFELSVFHLGLTVTMALGFYFIKTISGVSQGSSSLERMRDKYDNTYHMDFDKAWEIIFGKTYFPLQFLFSPWLSPQIHIDQVMKEYYGFEIE